MRTRVFAHSLHPAQRSACQQAALDHSSWLDLDCDAPIWCASDVDASDAPELFAFVASEVEPVSAIAWLTHARQWLSEHPDAAGCGARLESPTYHRDGWELLYPHLIRHDMLNPSCQRAARLEPYMVQHIVRGIFVVRSSALRNVGGFNQELGDSFLADVDLCRRLRQAGASLWLLPEPPVARMAVAENADQAAFERQAEAFARRQPLAAPAPIEEGDWLWFMSNASLNQALTSALEVARSATASLQEAQQELFAIRDFTFRSRVPIVGGLIAAFRQAWFGVAAKWALRAYRQQQARVNAQHAEAIHSLAAAIQQIIGTLDKKAEVEVQKMQTDAQRIADRLNRMLSDGA